MKNILYKNKNNFYSFDDVIDEANGRKIFFIYSEYGIDFGFFEGEFPIITYYYEDKLCFDTRFISASVNETNEDVKDVFSGIFSNYCEFGYIQQEFFLFFVSGIIKKLSLINDCEQYKKTINYHISNKNHLSDKSGYVYFFYDSSSCLTKIGKAKNPDARIKIFLTGNPNISMVFSIKTDDALKLEGLIHRRYSNLRVSGEWFDIPLNELSSYFPSSGIGFDISDSKEILVEGSDEFFKTVVFSNENKDK